MIAAVRSRVTLRYRSQANEAISKLRNDAEILGIGPVSLRTRAHLRLYYEGRLLARLAAVPIVVFEWWLATRVTADLVYSNIPSLTPPDSANPPPPSSSGLMGLARVATMTAVILWPILLVRPTMTVLRYSEMGKPLAFRPLAVWAGLIGQCADVVRNPGPEHTHVADVSTGLTIIRVRWARFLRGSVPLNWNRQVRAKAHAGRVAAALRRAEQQLDESPEEGAKELGRLTLQICDRYVDKRLGALLDEEQLNGYERSHELLRLCLSLACMGTVALGASAAHLPPPVAIAVAGIAAAVIHRNAFVTGLTVLVPFLPLLFTVK
ncbi:hypothetical protein [Streptomyces alfalfae]